MPTIVFCIVMLKTQVGAGGRIPSLGRRLPGLFVRLVRIVLIGIIGLGVIEGPQGPVTVVWGGNVVVVGGEFKLELPQLCLLPLGRRYHKKLA